MFDVTKFFYIIGFHKIYFIKTEVILKLVEIEKVALMWNSPQNPKTIKKRATDESKHENKEKSNKVHS